MTPSSLDICSLLARGLTIGQAAQRLDVARWQVTELLERAKTERGCRTTCQLVALVVKEQVEQSRFRRQRYQREYMRGWRRGVRRKRDVGSGG